MSNRFLDNRLYQPRPPMTSQADNFESKRAWTTWKNWLMCDVCVSAFVCFRTWTTWAASAEFYLNWSFHRTTIWLTFRRTQTCGRCVCVCVRKAPANTPLLCVYIWLPCVHMLYTQRLSQGHRCWGHVSVCRSPRCLRLIPDKLCQPAQTRAASSVNVLVGVVRVGDACVCERVKVVVWVQHARGIQNKSIDA